METATGEQLKLEGLELAASKYGPDLIRAQQIAQLIGMLGRVITAEDVREAFQIHTGYELKIGNAMGSLFVDGQWEFAGYVSAKRPQARGRKIASWRLRAQL